MTAVPLRQNVREILRPIDGQVSVALRVVEGPSKELGLRPHAMFHAASTMKTPVMIETYRQASEGAFALDDSLRVKNDFQSVVEGHRFSVTPEEDSDEELYEHIGKRRSIRDLLRRMITASSNLATNLLVGHVGADATTRTMRRFGADRIQVRRGVEDSEAYRRGINNETTAHDLLVIFEHLARGKVVDSVASEEMIDLLRAQRYNGIIPALLPDAVEVAHKTGWIAGVQHDSGIVFVPGGPTYVLILLSQNLDDEATGRAALSRISRVVFDAVTE